MSVSSKLSLLCIYPSPFLLLQTYLASLPRIVLQSLSTFSLAITTCQDGCPHGCAISLSLLHSFYVEDIFLSAHLDHSANLLTFVVFSDSLTSASFRMGIEQTCFCLLSLERGRYDLPLNVRRCIDPVSASCC